MVKRKQKKNHAKRNGHDPFESMEHFWKGLRETTIRTVDCIIKDFNWILPEYKASTLLHYLLGKTFVNKYKHFSKMFIIFFLVYITILHNYIGLHLHSPKHLHGMALS
jgi:hypothetical protein